MQYQIIWFALLCVVNHLDCHFSVYLFIKRFLLATQDVSTWGSSRVHFSIYIQGHWQNEQQVVQAVIWDEWRSRLKSEVILIPHKHLSIAFRAFWQGVPAQLFIWVVIFIIIRREDHGQVHGLLLNVSRWGDGGIAVAEILDLCCIANIPPFGEKSCTNIIP